MTKQKARTHSASKPLYAQIVRSLAKAIYTHRYPVGSLLPPELELCKKFHVSRHTVREALRRLKEMGLISRRKRSGTRVEPATRGGNYTLQLTSIAELLQYAAETSLVPATSHRILAVGDICDLLQCRSGSRWLHVTGLRYAANAGTEPICWTEIYVAHRYSGIGGQIGRTPEPVYTLIERKYGRIVTALTQEIKATTIKGSIATALNVKRGSPGLLIIRRYLGPDDSPIEVAMSVHPASRFTYYMRLQRDNWRQQRAFQRTGLAEGRI